MGNENEPVIGKCYSNSPGNPDGQSVIEPVFQDPSMQTVGYISPVPMFPQVSLKRR